MSAFAVPKAFPKKYQKCWTALQKAQSDARLGKHVTPLSSLIGCLEEAMSFGPSEAVIVPGDLLRLMTFYLDRELQGEIIAQVQRLVVVLRQIFTIQSMQTLEQFLLLICPYLLNYASRPIASPLARTCVLVLDQTLDKVPVLLNLLCSAALSLYGWDESVSEDIHGLFTHAIQVGVDARQFLLTIIAFGDPLSRYSASCMLRALFPPEQNFADPNANVKLPTPYATNSESSALRAAIASLLKGSVSKVESLAYEYAENDQVLGLQMLQILCPLNESTPAEYVPEFLALAIGNINERLLTQDPLFMEWLKTAYEKHFKVFCQCLVPQLPASIPKYSTLARDDDWLLKLSRIELLSRMKTFWRAADLVLPHWFDILNLNSECRVVLLTIVSNVSRFHSLAKSTLWDIHVLPVCETDPVRAVRWFVLFSKLGVLIPVKAILSLLQDALSLEDTLNLFSCFEKLHDNHLLYPAICSQTDEFLNRLSRLHRKLASDTPVELEFVRKLCLLIEVGLGLQIQTADSAENTASVAANHLDPLQVPQHALAASLPHPISIQGNEFWLIRLLHLCNTRSFSPIANGTLDKIIRRSADCARFVTPYITRQLWTSFRRPPANMDSSARLAIACLSASPAHVLTAVSEQFASSNEKERTDAAFQAVNMIEAIVAVVCSSNETDGVFSDEHLSKLSFIVLQILSVEQTDASRFVRFQTRALLEGMSLRSWNFLFHWLSIALTNRVFADGDIPSIFRSLLQFHREFRSKGFVGLDVVREIITRQDASEAALLSGIQLAVTMISFGAPASGGASAETGEIAGVDDKGAIIDRINTVMNGSSSTLILDAILDAVSPANLPNEIRFILLQYAPAHLQDSPILNKAFLVAVSHILTTVTLEEGIVSPLFTAALTRLLNAVTPDVYRSFVHLDVVAMCSSLVESLVSQYSTVVYGTLFEQFLSVVRVFRMATTGSLVAPVLTSCITNLFSTILRTYSLSGIFCLLFSFDFDNRPAFKAFLFKYLTQNKDISFKPVEDVFRNIFQMNFDDVKVLKILNNVQFYVDTAYSRKGDQKQAIREYDWSSLEDGVIVVVQNLRVPAHISLLVGDSMAIMEGLLIDTIQSLAEINPSFPSTKLAPFVKNPEGIHGELFALIAGLYLKGARETERKEFGKSTALRVDRILKEYERHHPRVVESYFRLLTADVIAVENALASGSAASTVNRTYISDFAALYLPSAINYLGMRHPGVPSRSGFEASALPDPVSDLVHAREPEARIAAATHVLRELSMPQNAKLAKNFLVPVDPSRKLDPRKHMQTIRTFLWIVSAYAVNYMNNSRVEPFPLESIVDVLVSYASLFDSAGAASKNNEDVDCAHLLLCALKWLLLRLSVSSEGLLAGLRIVSPYMMTVFSLFANRPNLHPLILLLVDFMQRLSSREVLFSQDFVAMFAKRVAEDMEGRSDAEWLQLRTRVLLQLREAPAETITLQHARSAVEKESVSNASEYLYSCLVTSEQQ
eukprot:ANDGO_01391.mRNA.1 hypothetical protein